MKKYELFREWERKEIYGENLSDAIMHAGSLSRPGRYEDKKFFPGEKMKVERVLGLEDTSTGTRGNKVFMRAVVEFDDGTRESIDAVECGALFKQ